MLVSLRFDQNSDQRHGGTEHHRHTHPLKGLYASRVFIVYDNQETRCKNQRHVTNNFHTKSESFRNSTDRKPNCRNRGYWNDHFNAPILPYEKNLIHEQAVAATRLFT